MIIGIIIAILLCALIGAIVYNGHCHKIVIVETNANTRALNKQAEQELEWTRNEITKKEQELSQIKHEIRETSVNLSRLNSSLEQTTEEYSRIAEERAQKAHEARMKSLDIEYAAAVADLQDTTRQELKDYKMVKNELAKAQGAIQDLQAKQLAYIQTKQREEEMRVKQDYYRLMLSEEDQQDVKFLREVQTHLVHKEAIDKIIWDGYYKSAFDTLASHIFSSVSERKCGIYRITCLTNDKAYIGQSVDIRDRWKQHIKTALAHTSTLNKLYQEMKQQGIENFTFEIVEEVARPQLNEREVYWIDFYKTRDWGLNSTRGGS